MKGKIIGGVAAMSLALATFAAFSITASAATYTASTYNSSKPVGAKSVNQGDIFEKGAYIKQDGGGRNWYVTDARSILFLTYANNPTYTGTSETRNDLTVQVKGNDRYKYWKVTKKESNYIQDGLNNRYDYSITLSPNDPSYNAPTAKSPTYNGNAQALANAATSVSGCTVKYSTDNSNWSTSVPQGTNAGKYTVYYKVEHSNYFNNLDKTASVTVTINKAASTYITEPSAKTLTWSGEAQDLVTAGTTTCGTVQYKLGNDGEWSTTVPTATAVGSYTVYYKVVGDENHNDIAEKSVTVTISKADAALTTAPAANSLTWTGAAQELVTAGAATGGEVQYKLGDGEWSTTVPTATAVGSYTVYYKVVGDENHNDIAENNVTVEIGAKDAEATYKNINDIGGEDYDGEASAWTVTVTPGSTAITSMDVKVNGKSSDGAWSNTSTLSGGPVIFGVVVKAAATEVTSMTAVVNGADVQATPID